MVRMKHEVNDGAWVKRPGRCYRHESGVEVVYLPNLWMWQIRGGAQDGMLYERLWAAQHMVELFRA